MISMKVTAVSVPDVVREIITRHRSIYDCMKMDIINYTALAVKIQPEVEKQLGNPVNLNTIVVAIKRFADSFEQKEEVKEKSILKNARLSLTDGILDIRLSKNDFPTESANSLLEKFAQITPDYEFFRLTDSLRFLTEDIADIRKLFDSLPGTESVFNTGLAKIKITLPPDQNRSDAVSYVAELLHANGIELVNAYFSQDNIIIILNVQDAPKAYDALRAEIAK